MFLTKSFSTLGYITNCILNTDSIYKTRVVAKSCLHFVRRICLSKETSVQKDLRVVMIYFII